MPQLTKHEAMIPALYERIERAASKNQLEIIIGNKKMQREGMRSTGFTTIWDERTYLICSLAETSKLLQTAKAVSPRLLVGLWMETLAIMLMVKHSGLTWRVIRRAIGCR